MGYLIFSAFTCFLPDRLCGTNSIPGFHHGVWQKRRSKKTLRIFTREEGGFHHCQVDDATIGVHTMFDWIADVLNARK